MHQKNPTGTERPMDQAPFMCKYCGAPSWIEPSDQSRPPDYCHESDHGTDDDRAEWLSCDE